jgi:hypothetical protein
VGLAPEAIGAPRLVRIYRELNVDDRAAAVSEADRRRILELT